MSKHLGSERRRQPDRRQSERSGKYDRRKNRCGGCSYYSEQSSSSGNCQKHQKMVRADEHACVWFSATSDVDEALNE